VVLVGDESVDARRGEILSFGHRLILNLRSGGMPLFSSSSERMKANLTDSGWQTTPLLF